MTNPFIIWTTRRTGGTSLANILKTISGYEVEHEPFNWDRTFGFIAKKFHNDQNFDDLQTAVNEYCINKKICIKHCYEICGDSLNDSLIKVLAKSNYKHLFLLRKNELERLISLYLAQQTSAWGKQGSDEIYQKYLLKQKKLNELNIQEMVIHSKYCQKIIPSLQQKMLDSNISFIELYYENLYSGTYIERKEYLLKICQHLQIDTEIVAQNLSNLRYWLMDAKQESNSLYHLIPNYSEIRRTFAELYSSI